MDKLRMIKKVCHFEALFSCFFSTHIASQNSSPHKIGATVKRRVAYDYSPQLQDNPCGLRLFLFRM